MHRHGYLRMISTMFSFASALLFLSWLSIIITATPTALLETRKSPTISVSKFSIDCSGFADVLACTSKYTMKVSYDPGKNADSTKGCKIDGVTCAGSAIQSHAGLYTDCDSTSVGMKVSARVTAANKVEIKMDYTGDDGKNYEACGLWYDAGDSDKTSDDQSFSMEPTFN
ncbi:hypothetical protein ACMFMG_009991 [Clarireedia jacksonii]